MKRTLVLSCALLALGAAATAAHAAPAKKDACASKPSKWAREQCEDFTHSAPGDQYFGRLKLSYLGINNTFHDETIRAGAYTTDPSIIHDVSFADEALNQWSHLYPNDPQLARTYFLAIQLYKKIYTQSAQQKAWSYMQLLVHRFPTTYFGKIMKADLARGFTEHWFANPQMCPTPLPAGVKPEATPDATPTPAPQPGRPNVDIITPPCVQPSIAPSSAPSTKP